MTLETAALLAVVALAALGLGVLIGRRRSPSERPVARDLPRAPAGVASVDGGGRLLQWNDRFVSDLGGSFVVHHELAALAAPAERPAILAALADPVDTFTSDGIELAGQGGDAATLTLHLGAVEADGCRLVWLGRRSIGVATIDPRLAQASKMQAIGQLAGGVAHDFNNLLTAMIGFCDLLLARHRPGDQSFADIMQIKQNANRAAGLIRQLLAFSRRQTLDPTFLDVGDVIAELSHLLRRLIGPNVRLDLATGRDLGFVRADQGQFEQVIVNLVVNARDAMPEGGKLSIRIGSARVEAPRPVGPDLMPPGDYLVVEVADTGIGIPEAVRGRLFEPFFTTKPVGQGTGLGLATVYGIVRQSGGFVSVESEVGVGSSFLVWLPRFGGTVVQPRHAAPSAEEGDLAGTGTLLLVEDEDPVRLFAARALRAKGYRVIEASSGEVALDLLGQGSETPDLMVTDMIMPGMDGVALIAAVRERLPRLPVVCISGHTDDTIRARLADFRGVQFLSKPFSLAQLAARVRDARAAGLDC